MYSSGLAQTSVTTDVKSSSNLQSLLEMLHLCLYLVSDTNAVCEWASGVVYAFPVGF